MKRSLKRALVGLMIGTLLLGCGRTEVPPSQPVRVDETSQPSAEGSGLGPPAIERLPVAITGTWAALPPAPIPGRFEAALVWSNSEVIVWASATVDPVVRPNEAAAFDPLAATWRVLPDSGLRPRRGALATWTGHELLVWGGVTVDDFRPLVDGAAYDPGTDRWRPLPPSPLRPAIARSAYWTGTAWVIASKSGDSQIQLAKFDPVAGEWTELPLIDRPADTVALVGDDQGLLALVLPLEGRAVLFGLGPSGWAELAAPPFDGIDVGEYPIWSGRDLVASAAGRGAQGRVVPGTPFIYDRDHGEWRTGFAPPAATGGANPLWTGRVALYYAGSGPSLAYDPATDRWSQVDAAAPELPGLGYAVWAGDRLVVWGGGNGDSLVQTNVGIEFVPDDPAIGIPLP